MEAVSAQVFSIFRHEYNALDVARQEYELAKEHYRHTCERIDSASNLKLVITAGVGSDHVDGDVARGRRRARWTRACLWHCR